MNNIEYGNYLRDLREQNNLTQRYVGYQLDLTDKNISKWETAKSKPNLEQLKKLSAIYNVSLEELLNNQTQEKEINITKIVITGGPCAGKTTALNWINNYFSKRGYAVLFIPETATELISNGITPWNSITNYAYQYSQMKLQKIKEEIYSEAARSLNNSKVLIVCDRGMLDNKAYMEPFEFKRILKELNTNETKERDSYDAVFHLVTAAKGKEKFYNLSHNIARKESLKEAKISDDKIISAWTGHPHFRVIDNSTDFEEKLERLLKEITSFLGEPDPLEIERKFLINYPDIKLLENLPNCTKVDISQTYLKNEDGTERRIRARGIDGDYIYYLTEKKSLSNITRIETEKKLTQEEYLKYLMQADNNLRTIRKTRYCLTDNNQYFEIDIFPEWDKQAIMEIELNSEDQAFTIPSFIQVYKEVTDENEYKNYEMAKEMPEQLIN